MNYSSYQDRKAGDRVVDQAGKSGIVTEIQKRDTSGEAIAVRWDDGSIALIPVFASVKDENVH